MSGLMEIEEAATEHNPDEKWKGEGKGGRPKSRVKRKQRLVMLRKDTDKQIQTLLRTAEKYEGKKFNKSLIHETAIQLLSESDNKNWIKTLDEILRGE